MRTIFGLKHDIVLIYVHQNVPNWSVEFKVFVQLLIEDVSQWLYVFALSVFGECDCNLQD